MNTIINVGRSFGRIGSKLFSAANVVQLVGWTAIMIMSGAAAAVLLVPAIGMVGWCIVIGALIVLWIAIGIKRMPVCRLYPEGPSLPECICDRPGGVQD